MAEETLVKEALTDQMIEAGASVLQSLDRRNFAVDAALWWYLTDANLWRFLLATPEVHLQGPRKAYKRLFHTLRNAAVHNVSVENIAVVDSRDPFIQLLRTAVGVDPSRGGVRFSRNTINGQFIEDAYIYRRQPNNPKSQSLVESWNGEAMKSGQRGAATSRVEVTNISPHGFWLLLGERELFVSFKEFPWFEQASVAKISHVEWPSEDHLYWPQLDVDLSVRSVEHPEEFPLKFRVV